MLRFSLTDYTNCNCTPVIIEEPVGWDGITMRLKRAATWHGFFDFFDDSLTSIQFDNASYPSLGNGYAILKAAYDKEGSEARVDILIEFQCSETDEFETLYTGRCNFGRNYKEHCGDRCYIEVGIETTSCIMVFKNRYDQKVDLDSLVPFDEPQCECSETAEVTGSFIVGVGYGIFINTADGHEIGDLVCIEVGDTITIADSDSNDGTYTVVSFIPSDIGALIEVAEEVVEEGPLSAFTITGCLFKTEAVELETYVGLNKEIMLPTKILRLETKWLAKEDAEYTYLLEFPNPFAYRFIITPDWPNIISEIENTNVGLALFVDALPVGGGSGPTPDYGSITDENPPDEMINFTGNVAGGSLKCTGTVTLQLKFHYKVTNGTLVDEFRIYVVKDFAFNAPYVGQTVGPQQWYWDLNDGAAGYDFDETITFDIVAGETIWIWFDISAQSGAGSNVPVSLLLSEGGFFDLKIDSECEDTLSNVYLINEVMSRITEAYTNDCLRVYSDYFGRIDAQPYPSDADGCGALESITNGLKVRAKNGTVPTGDAEVIPKVTVSMQDVFEAMNAIHNIGMGIEPDTVRGGDSEIIRVEPVHYFYKNDILMECDHILDVTREVVPQELFSIIKAGYAKWETESVNGLNDVFGRREYRTLLRTVKNIYERVCKFIASDSAIEITRRLYGSTTKDWRYDNEIFIICLKNSYLAFEGEVIEYIAGNTIKIHDFNLANAFFNGDQVTTTGGAQAGTYDVTGVSIVGDDTILTIVQTVVNEVSGDVLYNDTHPIKKVEIDNVGSSDKILYPDYCYNLRITPARNVLRHFKTILSNYRDFATGKLKFTNGDGNYVAEIELDSVDECLNEINTPGDDGTDERLAENTDIDLSKFQSPDDNHPLYWPERVKFDYAVTWQQYKDIKANPCGQIKYQCSNGEWEYGWIDDFQLKPTGPKGGIATFILKPKIET